MFPLGDSDGDFFSTFFLGLPPLLEILLLQLREAFPDKLADVRPDISNVSRIPEYSKL